MAVSQRNSFTTSALPATSAIATYGPSTVDPPLRIYIPMPQLFCRHNPFSYAIQDSSDVMILLCAIQDSSVVQDSSNVMIPFSCAIQDSSAAPELFCLLKPLLLVRFQRLEPSYFYATTVLLHCSLSGRTKRETTRTWIHLTKVQPHDLLNKGLELCP